MKILLASAEVAPFAKVGGMADVAGALPAALRANNIDARVIMPGYGFINHDKHHIRRLFTFQFTHRLGTSDVHVFTAIYRGVPHYFVQAFPYFGQGDSTYTIWDWDIPRFIFFNQLVMAVAWELHKRLDWMADVIHANDWHTALLPFLVARNRYKSEWQQTSSVITIHNIAYQGDHVGGSLWNAGIDGRDHEWLQHDDLSDNLLAIGISYADMINTVSPTYAKEIHYPYAGFNLVDLIQRRTQDVIGILNGLDTVTNDPTRDPHLIANFDKTNFVDQRRINKRHLQSYAKLPISDNTPIVGMVTRLAWQKGFDFAVPALRQLLEEENVQVIILGTGDAEIEDDLRALEKDFPHQMRAMIEFDISVAQQIYAGCDMFLMPSHFEPCGIGQMIAMRYGALPVVRKTGGLADTVANYDNGSGDVGTGFVFEWEEPQAIVGTIKWAIQAYHTRQGAWQMMQARAMQQEFSWEHSAKDYIALYEQALRKIRGL